MPIEPESPERLRRRARMSSFIASFIIGLSEFLSYDWQNGGFRQDAPLTILFSILVAGILFIAVRFGRRDPSYFFPVASCPSCRRVIPADSSLCPYCGRRLR